MKQVLGLALATLLTGMLAGCPKANIRAIHASPDAPPVDICANGMIVFEAAAFPGATDYASVAPGSYDLKVVAAGAGCDAAGVIEATVMLDGGTDTTVVAANLLESIEPIVLMDDNATPSAGMAKVSFVHTSPNAPTVDITLTDGTTLFDDISFRENGGYIEVAAGTYDLQVRDETGASVVLTLSGVTLEAGRVYSVFAVGLLDGDPALDALLTVDN